MISTLLLIAVGLYIVKIGLTMSLYKKWEKIEWHYGQKRTRQFTIDFGFIVGIPLMILGLAIVNSQLHFT